MLRNRVSATHYVHMDNMGSLRKRARNSILLSLSGVGEQERERLENTELKITEIKAVFRAKTYRSIFGRQ